MAENIWQFSDKGIKAESSFFALLDDVQIVLKSAKGKISEHHITKNSEEIPSDCSLVNFSPKFDIVPSKHTDTQILNSPVSSHYSFDNEIVIRNYSGENDHILPYLLLLLAKESKHDEVVTAYFSKNYLTLVYLSNKQCYLANSFVIRDISEIVYFFTSVANQHGKSINDIHFEVYSSLEEKEIKAITEDYIPNIEIMKAVLPYKSDEMPPFSAESHLLLKLGECELPAEL